MAGSVAEQLFIPGCQSQPVHQMEANLPQPSPPAAGFILMDDKIKSTTSYFHNFSSNGFIPGRAINGPWYYHCRISQAQERIPPDIFT